MSETRLKRWRLILGEHENNKNSCSLSDIELGMDKSLAALYQDNEERGADLGSSSPQVARWLGDIRTYFPSSVVQVMQKDALERLGLQQMLMEPELLEAIDADIHLVTQIISLSHIIPEKTKETARQVVRKVVEDLMEKLQAPMRQAITGSLNRAQRTRRPRHSDIDWNRTIRANLKHYQPDYQSIIPEQLIGFGRKQKQTDKKNIILCVDQSGSMASSVVYSSIFAAVLASLPTVNTHMVLFDTEVVDLTADMEDPVDLLFGAQLGGGTDINRALTYCQKLIHQPQETILVLISDLYEGGNEKRMLQRALQIAQSGVQFIALLALSDQGHSCYDQKIAQTFAGFNIPSFACTPDQFPDLMAAAIEKRDIQAWAGERGIQLSRA